MKITEAQLIVLMNVLYETSNIRGEGGVIAGLSCEDRLKMYRSILKQQEGTLDTKVEDEVPVLREVHEWYRVWIHDHPPQVQKCFEKRYLDATKDRSRISQGFWRSEENLGVHFGILCEPSLIKEMNDWAEVQKIIRWDNR